MSKNLRKFVNPRFINTIDLDLIRRLLERHDEDLHGFDLAVFDQDEAGAREAIAEFFAGPEVGYPDGLIADLHRIAEIGDANGLQIILENAARHQVSLLPVDGAGQVIEAPQEPKHVALRVFLDYPAIFNSAVDMLAYRSLSSFSEFAGLAEGIEAEVNDKTLQAFQDKAAAIFEANMRGRFCEAQSYDDDGDLNIVVTHGAPFKTTETLGDGQQRAVISFRELEHAVVIYTPSSGILKIGRIAKAQREQIAEIFATEFLGKPGFFSAPDAQNLYTLAPVERGGFNFAIDHDYDPGIVRVQITEVQVNRIATDQASGKTMILYSMVARDGRDNALARLGETSTGIVLGAPEWQVNHIVIKVHFNTGAKRPAKVTVKLKAPAAPMFKRQRFEGRIMTLLRRNGFVRDRNPDALAAAAE